MKRAGSRNSAAQSQLFARHAFSVEIRLALLRIALFSPDLAVFQGQRDGSNADYAVMFGHDTLSLFFLLGAAAIVAATGESPRRRTPS